MTSLNIKHDINPNYILMIKNLIQFVKEISNCVISSSNIRKNELKIKKLLSMIFIYYDQICNINLFDNKISNITVISKCCKCDQIADYTIQNKYLCWIHSQIFN